MIFMKKQGSLVAKLVLPVKAFSMALIVRVEDSVAYVSNGLFRRVCLRNLDVQEQGYTMVEILIVVVVLGTLATLALPNYQTVIEKVKTSEGVHILTTLRGAQQRYALENDGVYTDDLADLDVTIPASAYFNAPSLFANGDASVDRNGSDPYDYSLTITAAGVISCSEGGGGGSICSKLGF